MSDRWRSIGAAFRSGYREGEAPHDPQPVTWSRFLRWWVNPFRSKRILALPTWGTFWWAIIFRIAIFAIPIAIVASALHHA